MIKHLKTGKRDTNVNIIDGIAWTVDDKSIVRWCTTNLPDCVAKLDELIAAEAEFGMIFNGKLHLGSVKLQIYGAPLPLPITPCLGERLDLSKDIEWVKKAAGTDATLPTFGVFISKEYQVGLDGHRMHIIKQTADHPDFRIHPAAFAILKNTVVINHSSVDKPDHGVHYPVISTPYPPFENVLKTFVPTHQAIIKDTSELIDGLKKAKKLAKKDSWVLVTFGEKIKIKTTNYDISFYWEQSGEPFDIFVNINYLVDALLNFPSIKISKRVEPKINGDQVLIEHQNHIAMLMGINRNYMRTV